MQHRRPDDLLAGRAAPERANPRRRRRRPRAPATCGGRARREKRAPEHGPKLPRPAGPDPEAAIQHRENHLGSTRTREVAPRPNSATPLTESSSEQARTRVPRSGASRPRIPASSDQIRAGKPRGAARIRGSGKRIGGETKRIQGRQRGTHLD